MFKTEKNQELNCVVYYKPAPEVLRVSLNIGKIAILFNSEYKTRLEYLFTYKIKDRAVKDAILKFVRGNYNLSDKKVYDGILKITAGVTCDENRGGYRIKSINKYINNWDKILPTFYLDIGCFQGDITETIGQHFNLNKFQTRGIDIKKYVENEHFIFSEYDGKNIPFNDESFDLITCFMVLHHIPAENLDILLADIFRVMKPEGLLIIREHNAEGKDNLLLDTLHEFYDYVLNPLHVWNESSAQYFSLKNLEKKITGVGFKSYCVPKVNRCNPKNPFNNYVASFKKPRKQKIHHEFFRILTPDFYREPYKSHMYHRRHCIHWGQRKLLLSEIEFICLYFEKFPEAANVVVIYAGAAPGTHILILRDLFPAIRFVLYDPAQFDNAIYNVHGISIHQEIFTDEVCLLLKDQYTDSVVLFISDIRTADTVTMSAEDVEKRVACDQQMQMKWYDILNPAMAMLKFRLPWNCDTTLYLKGDIYFQAYAPLTSTETRLIVEQNAPLIEYDNKAYEEQLFHFNMYLRELYYRVAENETGRKSMMYDAAVEHYILKKYDTLNSTIHFCEHKTDFLMQFSNHIDNVLSRNRTLIGAQPLSHNKKELVKKLIRDGLVPPSIKYTVDDYNLYVMPIIGRI